MNSTLKSELYWVKQRHVLVEILICLCGRAYFGSSLTDLKTCPVTALLRS